MILGDLNCHFGSDIASLRTWGKTTANARKFQYVCNRQSLSIADLDASCKGPNYTFHVEGVGMSYIDHCVVSEAFRNRILCCRVLPDDVMNFSDHLPLHVVINANLPTVERCNTQRVTKFAWNKLSNDEIRLLYTNPLECKLKRLLVEF